MEIIEVLLTSNRTGYFCLFFMVLFFCLFKAYRTKAVLFLNVMNLLMAFFGVVGILLLMYNLLADAGRHSFVNRMFGPYGWFFQIGFVGLFLSQFLWLKRLRTNILFSAFVFVFCAFYPFLGERIVIFFTSLYRDYIPSSWAMHTSMNVGILLWACGYAVIVGTIVYLLNRNRANFSKSQELTTDD